MENLSGIAYFIAEFAEDALYRFMDRDSAMSAMQPMDYLGYNSVTKNQNFTKRGLVIGFR